MHHSVALVTTITTTCPQFALRAPTEANYLIIIMRSLSMSQQVKNMKNKQKVSNLLKTVQTMVSFSLALFSFL